MHWQQVKRCASPHDSNYGFIDKRIILFDAIYCNYGQINLSISSDRSIEQLKRSIIFVKLIDVVEGRTFRTKLNNVVSYSSLYNTSIRCITVPQSHKSYSEFGVGWLF